jgi:hypothetical protein
MTNSSGSILLLEAAGVLCEVAASAEDIVVSAVGRMGWDVDVGRTGSAWLAWAAVGLDVAAAVAGTITNLSPGRMMD